MTMPSLFIGHGSPINAIEENRYTKEWKKIGELYHPKGIIMISAHWFVNDTYTQDQNSPKKVNDMYGFPRALYELSYPVMGDQELTDLILAYLGNQVVINNDWGIDHGAWSVLNHMYPNADIPVVQISIDRNKAANEHFELGKLLLPLRQKGYMIIGSGNVVHNLGKLDPNAVNPTAWAESFDNHIQNCIMEKKYTECIAYESYGVEAQLSVPTPDHFLPLLYVIGAIDEHDQVQVFNKGYELGSLSMTCYLFNRQ